MFIKNYFSDKDKVISNLIFSFFIFFALIIIWNLYNLQIKKGDYYRNRVLKRSSKFLNNSTFDRGKIYFKNKNKNIVVAIQQNGYILAVDNTNKNKFLRFNKPESVYKKISKIIKINKKEFIKKTSTKKRYLELKHRLTKEEANEIKKLKIKGIDLIEESWREYPFNEIGGKLIGFLNVNKDGVSGLEKFYNEELKRNFKKKKRNIFLNIFSKEIDDIFAKKEIKREGDLYSTIDINLQSFLEKKLKEITAKFSSKDSLGVIIKPNSGEILAMSDAYPFDFNKKKKDFRNKMVEFRYEPGSIIKPLVVSMGLDSNSINSSFSYNDVGCIKVQKYKVCNYDKRARGPNTNLVRIIKESLNLGMVAIEKRIKRKTLLEYFLKFGLSEETGVDLPNEVAPDISSLNYNVDINYATAAFGQGIAISPIAMIRALSVIANDGYLVNPHLISEINYGDEIPSKKIEIKKKKILKTKTADLIQKIMIRAVNETASKQKYQRKMYSVAAKTGTAQIAAKGGGYKKGVNIHAFFGFFPATAKPEDRYAILLYTFEPRAKYSSQTLTKPFYDILDFLISYYNIKPDRIK